MPTNPHDHFDDKNENDEEEEDAASRCRRIELSNAVEGMTRDTRRRLNDETPSEAAAAATATTRVRVVVVVVIIVDIVMEMMTRTTAMEGMERYLFGRRGLRGDRKIQEDVVVALMPKSERTDRRRCNILCCNGTREEVLFSALLLRHGKKMMMLVCVSVWVWVWV